MQNYLEYNLLRLFKESVKIVFLILFFAFSSHMLLANDLVEGEVARDTLYRNWSKSKSTYPYFFYNLKNFEDSYQRSEVEGLVGTYGIGGIYLNNGNVIEVAEWLDRIKEIANISPIVIVNIDKIFELPFTFSSDQPSQVEIECLTDQGLITMYTLKHAALLKSMGVDVVHFEYLPSHYTQRERNRVVSYINQLHQNGLKLSFGKGTKEYLDRIGWSKIDWIPKSLAISEHYKSKKKAEKYFRKETGYKGFVIGDLDQVSFFSDKENQLSKGCDMLVLPEHVDSYLVINSLMLSGYNKGSIVKKPVKTYFKYWDANMIKDESRNVPFEVSRLLESNDVIEKSSITLIKDDQQIIPIQGLAKRKFYSFTHSQLEKPVIDLLDRYAFFEHQDLSYLKLSVDTVLNTIEPNSVLIVNLSSVLNNLEIKQYLEMLYELDKHHDVIVLYQGDRFNLTQLHFDVPTLWSSKLGVHNLLLMVQALFGVYDIQGELPHYIDNSQHIIPTYQRKSLNRLGYVSLSTNQYDFQKFKEIDEIVSSAIKDEVFPGCQIMMVKGREVVYEKNYGYLTYDSIASTKWNHLYDIASVTKTVATVPMVMSAISDGDIELSDRLGNLLEKYESSNKSDLMFAKLLTHQSGLRSYIPFWRHASYSSDSLAFLYQDKRYSSNAIRINWSDSIDTWIANSTYNSLKIEDDKYKYLYSDLGFMISKDIIEFQNSATLDYLADSLFYQPLGMNFTLFNPLDKFDSMCIAPTSIESNFRDKLLRGEVHDKNAALLGGVSGHAGLFSNANDLAKYMQMILQEGQYGGQRYLDSSLVKQFISKYDSTSLRGLGWDKPRVSVGNVSKYASEESFGHSGFTGALVWADPKYDLVYIFLSNRIYPNPENKKLMKQNIRTRIHDLMYESFLLEDNVTNQFSSSHL